MELVIVLGQGGVAIGASMTKHKEVNNPFISIEPTNRNLPIGTEPKEEDIDETRRVIIDIINKEGLEVLAKAIDICREKLEESSKPCE